MLKFIRGLGLTIVGLTILALWVVAAAANYAHSFQLAGDSEWADIIAAASAGADVLKAAALIAAVAAWRQKAFLACAAAGMIWCATTVWSVRSCFGFISTTLTDSYVNRDRDEAGYAALKNALTYEQEYLERLQKTDVTSLTLRSTISLRKEITDQRIVVGKVRADLAHSSGGGVADPVAAFIQRMYDVKPENVALGTALLFLVLLELVSNAGALAFAPLMGFRAAPRPQSRADEVTKLSLRAVAPGPSPSLPGGVPVIAPPQDQTQTTSARPQDATLVATAPMAAVAGAEHVATFVAVLVGKHGAGARLPTVDVQKAFIEFCGSQGISADVDPALLGKYLAAAGVTRSAGKDRHGRRHYAMPQLGLRLAAA